jgi:hypothetical protein
MKESNDDEEPLKESASPSPDPVTCEIGLAFSGGGIRSATFCFGVLQGLASNRLIGNISTLSTVSGGGYAGTLFGRLFNGTRTTQEIELGLASDNSMLVWWLRKNTRYLTPGGFLDVFEALGAYVRGLAAVHFELFIICALLAALFSGLHAITLSTYLNDIQPFLGKHDFVKQLPIVWWWLASLPLLYLIACFWAYWIKRSDSSIRWLPLGPSDLAIFLLFIAALALSTLSIFLPIFNNQFRAAEGKVNLGFTSQQLGVFLVSATLAVATIWRISNWHVGENHIRDRVTRHTAKAIQWIAVLVTIGVVDWVTLNLASQKNSIWATAPFKFLVAGALLVLIFGRTIAWIQRWTVSQNKPLMKLDLVVSLVGWSALALIVIGWVSAIRQVMYDEKILLGEWCLAVFLVSFLYVTLSGRNTAFANLSSFHRFYWARLTRAYVSIGNPARWAEVEPFMPSISENVRRVSRVSDVKDNDDCPIEEYAPDKHAVPYKGPKHFIMACLNQTFDDASGQWDADRKGQAVIVSHDGFSISAEPEVRKFERSNEHRLGHWVAVSGAAFSPGLGSNTRAGLAAMLFLCGIRLGYWDDLQRASPQENRTNSLGKFLSNNFAKYLAFGSEMMAHFTRQFPKESYLSDGGHFENTGVYALIKSKIKFIIAVDCGADPNYTFDDLQNLVRKVRIDFSCEIDFYDASDLNQLGITDLQYFAEPAAITTKSGRETFLLASIKYADGTFGTLIVIKPRVTRGLPIDVQSYANENPEFPQQTTADQFYSEAQFESYRKLGRQIAKRLSPTLLSQLPLGHRLHPETHSANVGGAPLPSAHISKFEPQMIRRKDPIPSLIKNVALFILSLSALSACAWVWNAWQIEERETEDEFRSAIDSVSIVLFSDYTTLATEKKDAIASVCALYRDPSLQTELISKRLNQLQEKLTRPGENRRYEAYLDSVATYIEGCRGAKDPNTFVGYWNFNPAFVPANLSVAVKTNFSGFFANAPDVFSKTPNPAASPTPSVASSAATQSSQNVPISTSPGPSIAAYEPPKTEEGSTPSASPPKQSPRPQPARQTESVVRKSAAVGSDLAPQQVPIEKDDSISLFAYPSLLARSPLHPSDLPVRASLRSI